ncbi:glycoside hydrolase family protein [Helicobacter cetorum]|uniref:glycoside hydrolase family protein n=1 Tax=Helicobacter cetorum TaxID=138563 RepID=UPI000CF1BA4B|nr:glycoside hydrolase family protein [Helicobacter cetorum]
MLCVSKLILAASFLLMDSEGFSSVIYTDKVGHATIGYGYNLSVHKKEYEYYKDKNITKNKAYFILVKELKNNDTKLLSYEWYKNLNKVRKMVILDLSYNLGLKGLLDFKQFIKAIEDENYSLAIERLQKSKYYFQVGKRAQRNMEFLQFGTCKNYCKEKYNIADALKEVGIELEKHSSVPEFFDEHNLTQENKNKETKKLKECLIDTLMRTKEGQKLLQEFLKRPDNAFCFQDNRLISM